MGNKINLKTDDGWESNFLPDTDNILLLTPGKNRYTFDLTLGRCRRAKFENPPFYLHFLADTSSVKFVYTIKRELLNQVTAISFHSSKLIALKIPKLKFNCVSHQRDHLTLLYFAI